ncbi:MAG: hypothetical protein C0482_03265 [Gordonia sp.]|nr:hypothetical protein [Gordonia sp. (in: high G+C Gram-positive bacteria)]
MQTERDNDLGAVTADLAAHIRTRLPQSIASVLEGIMSSAVDTIPGAECGGITIISKGHDVSSTAATHPTAALVDSLQSQFGQGPCVDAALQSDTVRADDLSSDSRWPAFTAAVLAQSPVRASLSFRLYTDREAAGALNLYSETPGAFGAGAEEIGLIHATHAAVTLYAARRNSEFDSALASRDVIGQAKGMIMERYDLDAVQAFDLLKRLSQDANTRLADVARKLVLREHPPAGSPKH